MDKPVRANYEDGFVLGAAAVKALRDQDTGSVQIEIKTSKEDLQIRIDRFGKVVKLWDRTGTLYVKASE